MRYITIVIPRIDDERCSNGQCAPDQAVTVEAIHHINLLDDGTGVGLYQLRGDFEQGTNVLEANPDVLACETSEASEGLVYLHFRANALMTDLLGIFRQYEIVVDWPMEYTDQGGLRVTMLGEDEKIRETIAEIPDGIQITLEGTGEYHSDTRRLASLLTERQQELLDLAIDEGYYEMPRRATLRDLADREGISAGTVGEHLRKIETKVIMELV
ncbi:helix-turn-helix domain-containing protein [Natrialba asiatica]|uniref:DNA binding protein n=1 Tax=Natrialba asiatica (strain ATCC 700177 / DSM 12278 / JCM 9576 / FERM P-10747 / NBRC 102637 / 172P1) TaxID=29540 RepID=M0AVL6_NATA1|nr:helix-turn-helix domain-containing protein [Natrialba asiatica]ELZ01988.1 DNA binding protein [Natrialba asiatica DSM 12278]